MSTLKNMIEFLEETAGSMDSINSKLEKIQAHFNSNFNNVVKVRSAEIEFLQDEYFKDQSQFPPEVTELYSISLETQKKLFQENLQDLKKKSADMNKTLNDINKTRITYMERLKKSNIALDKKEEALKEKIAILEKEIDNYNRKIDEMNTGFGFIINFLTMRKKDKLKKELIDKRDEYIGQIEDIRSRWIKAEKDIGKEDSKIQEQWNYLQAEYSILTEKIINLENNRDELIRKGAFTEALSTLTGSEKFLALKEKIIKHESCSRCGSANKKNLFFCDYCGEHFSENRPDIAGSLIETGELNIIFTSLMEGVKQCVSHIALMRGIKGGLDKFIKSIKEVKATQDRYSQLPTLKIEVPEFSREFAENLKKIDENIEVKLHNIHPLHFAGELEKSTASALAGTEIEKFFNLMGTELNKRTKEQWK